MIYTANYTRINSGYMGQLLEWPEIVTEGETLESCREMLIDAMKEMSLAYKQLGKAIPYNQSILEKFEMELENVS